MTSEFVVVCPPEVAPGFRLAGVRVRPANDPDQTVAAVQDASADRAGVVAVHGELWPGVPRTITEVWLRSTAPLILVLPEDTDEVTVERQRALRELLAHAVGYEIAFNPEESPR